MKVREWQAGVFVSILEFTIRMAYWMKLAGWRKEPTGLIDRIGELTKGWLVFFF